MSRRDIREADQIISVLTAERGKLELLARGVKKSTSKLAAHLEPCCFVHIETAPGREVEHVIGAQGTRYYPHIRASLEKRLAVQYVSVLVDMLVGVRERDSVLFTTVHHFFACLDTPMDYHPWFLDSAVLKIFSCLGFVPILDACVACQKKIPTDEWGFSFSGGGIVCPECRKKSDHQFAAVDCSVETLRTFRHFLDDDWEELITPALDPAQYARVHALIYRFCLYHSERQMSDWNCFLDVSGRR